MKKKDFNEFEQNIKKFQYVLENEQIDWHVFHEKPKVIKIINSDFDIEFKKYIFSNILKLFTYFFKASQTTIILNTNNVKIVDNDYILTYNDDLIKILDFFDYVYEQEKEINNIFNKRFDITFSKIKKINNDNCNDKYYNGFMSICIYYLNKYRLPLIPSYIWYDRNHIVDIECYIKIFENCFIDYQTSKCISISKFIEDTYGKFVQNDIKVRGSIHKKK